MSAKKLKSMKTAETHTEKARFDTRLSKEQKVIFERGAFLGV
jgi:hypothetical protein